MKNRVLFVFFLLNVFLVSLFFSCSKTVGYGVVIWKDEGDALELGNIVRIYAQSESSKIYVVGIDGEEGQYEVPMRKILSMPHKKDAMELKDRLEMQLQTYAACLSDGLPLREAPDNSSKQIYRLRENQLVKILWEGSGVPVERAGKMLEGKWFYVISDDGVQGWCFSHKLELFDARVGRREQKGIAVGILSKRDDDEGGSKEDVDEALERLLNSTWHPEYYRKMLNNRIVDLDRMSGSYGFFAGKDTKIAKVILPTIQRTFAYSEIKKIRDKYRFGDSPLSVYIRNTDIITVEFTDEEGTRLYENFVTLNASIEKIIENEKKRRAEEFKRLSGTYASQNYGDLEIKGEGYFVWGGYTALVPFVIPEGAGNGGELSLKYFISRSIKKQTSYQGVLSFVFSSMEETVDFMYEIKDGAVVMEPVLKECIEDGIVQDRSDAITLYFAKVEKGETEEKHNEAAFHKEDISQPYSNEAEVAESSFKSEQSSQEVVAEEEALVFQ